MRETAITRAVRAHARRRGQTARRVVPFDAAWWPRPIVRTQGGLHSAERYHALHARPVAGCALCGTR